MIPESNVCLIPFSIEGINSFGIFPPLTTLSNLNLSPRSNGDISSMQ